MDGRYPRVADFYQDSRIFLTGATGFLGKVLLSTLLRHFPGIECVYILVREKKGLRPERRIEEMFESVVFDTLKQEVPSFQSKIKVVEGNLEAENIGLSEADYGEISGRVNIIFHCAATLKFDEELRVAIRTNVCSTQHIVQLAKSCTNLNLFTYVSTAYSNANLKTIEERIRTPTTHYSSLIQLSELEEKERELYEETKKRLATENVNTYTLTKAAAEQLINEEATDIPASIFRPSIVIASSKDPVPGYIDNMYGPTGIVTGVMAGVVRVIHCDPGARADLVPVDMAVNALICSAWLSANRLNDRESQGVAPVYNYVSSTDNPITWCQFCDKMFRSVCQNPYSKTVWFCSYRIVSDETMYRVCNLVYHYLMGYILDLCAPLTRAKLRLVPMYRKLDKLMVALRPFSMNEWNFHNDNVHAVWDNLTTDERLKFPFDVRDIDWDTYLDTYMKGVLVHQLKDEADPESRKYALRRHRRLETAHHGLKYLLGMLATFFIWKILRFTGLIS